ncbi:MAG TPA: TrkA family potassium uptake protein [bacterium]|nr:TrkA family potassium uptake protein [bacterium]HPN44204.1 TrkA family potassium uptake protein [bacterium]
MHIIIVGGDKIVYFLTRLFQSKGHTVTIINRDYDDCTRLARSLKSVIIHGDGSDPAILEEAGAFTCNAILAITPNDQDNLIICQLGSKRFHITKTLALVNDPDNETVFTKLGVSTVFSITRILSNLIEQQTAFENVINLIPAAGGKVNMTEIILDGESPVIGRRIKDLLFPVNSLITIILRNDEPIVPGGDTTLLENDRIVVMTLPENHAQVIRLLTGEYM